MLPGGPYRANSSGRRPGRDAVGCPAQQYEQEARQDGQCGTQGDPPRFHHRSTTHAASSPTMARKRTIRPSVIDPPAIRSAVAFSV
jgi:hypothetical protein